MGLCPSDLITSFSSCVSMVPLSAAQPQCLATATLLSKQAGRLLTILVKAGERLSTRLYLRRTEARHQAGVRGQLAIEEAPLLLFQFLADVVLLFQVSCLRSRAQATGWWRCPPNPICYLLSSASVQSLRHKPTVPAAHAYEAQMPWAAWQLLWGTTPPAWHSSCSSLCEGNLHSFDQDGRL